MAHGQQFPVGRVFNLQSGFVAAAAGGVAMSYILRVVLSSDATLISDSRACIKIVPCQRPPLYSGSVVRTK